MQYEDRQAYMFGRDLAVLRKGLPPETFVYEGGISLVATTPKPELIATAIAHATWTSGTYEHLLYRLPEQHTPLEARLGAPRR
jgi:hypothetical protein